MRDPDDLPVMFDSSSSTTDSESDTSSSSPLIEPSATTSSDSASADKKINPEELREPSRSKADHSTCLNKEFPPDKDGFCFKNMADALASLEVVQWEPRDDPTIPKTHEEHLQIVKDLVDAFNSMSFAKGAQGNPYHKRFQAGKNTYYAVWTIEACAWNILRLVKSIHTEGFKAHIYDLRMLNRICQTQHWTFKERIDWIRLTLQSSKQVAAALMKHEKVEITIGAPHMLFNSTEVNYISNASRNDWVKRGREADEEHQNRVNVKRRKHEEEAAAKASRSLSPSANIKVASKKETKHKKQVQFSPNPTTITIPGNDALTVPAPYLDWPISTSVAEFMSASHPIWGGGSVKIPKPLTREVKSKSATDANAATKDQAGTKDDKTNKQATKFCKIKPKGSDTAVPTAAIDDNTVIKGKPSDVSALNKDTDTRRSCTPTATDQDEARTEAELEVARTLASLNVAKPAVP